VNAGKHTYGDHNIRLMWGKPPQVTMGKFCSIADNVTIFLGGDHAVEWISTYPFWVKGFRKVAQVDRWNSTRKLNVAIGNDVWIAGGVTIMRGVTIGDGAVIGRNSHVIRDVKPYSVVAGNPAEFLYFRFDKETIKTLLDLKWWDYDDKVIDELVPYLCSNDINGLVEECKKHKK
jgi:acetyltransferase-like isoleucine patch superfamily enzyme